MIQRFVGMSVVWLFTAIGWLVLSGTVDIRTGAADRTMKNKVGNLWGTAQTLVPPEISWSKEVIRKQESIQKDQSGSEVTTTRLIPETHRYNTPLQNSDIWVQVDLEHRRKGLLWYSTYTADFLATYQFANEDDDPHTHFFTFPLPDPNGVYDNFSCFLNDQPAPYNLFEHMIQVRVKLNPGETARISVGFRSFGQDDWRYLFRRDGEVGMVKDFQLSLITNFEDIDFPDGTLSPTLKEPTESGWKLTWTYSNLMSGSGIGIRMPSRINPGPFVSRVTRFAPVSLLFFFFVLFVITVVNKLPLRTEHYFFLACAFFAFHLLFAYLVDHVDLHLSFFISSVVSIFLVVSYLRLVAGRTFAMREAGLSQFIYLVLFSYSFFFEGYTGLIVTVGAILTLFITMQMTARRQHVIKGISPEYPNLSTP